MLPTLHTSSPPRTGEEGNQCHQHKAIRTRAPNINNWKGTTTQHLNQNSLNITGSLHQTPHRADPWTQYAPAGLGYQPTQAEDQGKTPNNSADQTTIKNHYRSQTSYTLHTVEERKHHQGHQPQKALCDRPQHGNGQDLKPPSTRQEITNHLVEMPKLQQRTEKEEERH